MSKINKIVSIDEQPADFDLGRLQSLFGFKIRRMSQIIQADLAKTLEPFGLRMITFSALSVIVDYSGIRQSSLADVLNIERANLVVVIDELENRELIRRDKVPSDRRAYALRPTLNGLKLLEESYKEVLAHEQSILSVFAKDESVAKLLRLPEEGDTKLSKKKNSKLPK